MKITRREVIGGAVIFVFAIAVSSYFLGVGHLDQTGKKFPNEISDRKSIASGKFSARPVGKSAISTVWNNENWRVKNRMDDTSNAEASEESLTMGDEAYRMAALEAAMEGGDKSEIQKAMEAVLDCLGCLQELVSILKDEAYDKEVRELAAIAIVKKGNMISEIVGAICRAVISEEYEWKEALLQALTYLDSSIGAGLLADFIAGKYSADLDYDQMPEDVKHAFAKAIRMVSDTEAVGTVLYERYLDKDTNELEQERLTDISHPVMLANLAATAYEEGNTEGAYEFMDQLRQGYAPGTLNALMGLASNENALIEDLISVMELWQKNHPDSSDQDHEALVDYISKSDSNQAERIAAAYGLASGADFERAVGALQKAYEHEEDPTVRQHIEAALNAANTARKRENPAQEMAHGAEVGGGASEYEKYDAGVSQEIKSRKDQVEGTESKSEQ